MLTACSLFHLLSAIVSWIAWATTVGSTLPHAGNTAFAKDVIAANLTTKKTTTIMMESKDADEKKKQSLHAGCLLFFGECRHACRAAPVQLFLIDFLGGGKDTLVEP
jgi:hypothetical protein